MSLFGSIIEGGSSTSLSDTSGIAVDEASADATLAPTGLSVPVRSGITYRVSAVLMIESGDPADGAKFDFTGSAAATSVAIAYLAVEDGAVANAGKTTALDTDIVITLVTGICEVYLNGSYTPSANGVFLIRYANNASTGPLTLKSGSYLALAQA